ncbi:2-phosphosulfolactate phosphatase [Branchiibius sp. NY16-3462-2]|uniref:2-phosphosulfolactate phosphatase n=1 Tax=Branchiibius sp. NY16-3462-2 TaxID=1807500 RepID=UPI0025BD0A6D|nr:2-phosphosulfolactate phosphatase [Branchiibius sp. NY16-3462-2]
MFGQGTFRIRCDWGLTGAQQLLGTSSATDCVVVVVDVLSFSTSTSIAVSRGAAVYPYRWHHRDDQLAAYAKQQGAVPAVGRLEASRPDALSLSPARLAQLPGLPARIVLPSPNGATISAWCAERTTQVFAGCVRNASALGAFLGRALYDEPGLTVSVIAAGEQWPDGTLRPAVEDLWGAGAVIAATGVPREDLSYEARAAADAFLSVRDDLRAALPATGSGIELAQRGFEDDVRYAAQLDADHVTPRLVDGAFRA